MSHAPANQTKGAHAAEGLLAEKKVSVSLSPSIDDTTEIEELQGKQDLIPDFTRKSKPFLEFVIYYKDGGVFQRSADQLVSRHSGSFDGFVVRDFAASFDETMGLP